MTKLDILNRAMLKCGLPLAASLDDSDYNAVMVYDTCVEEALRAHPWSFARGYAMLTQVNTAGQHGNRYTYQLPEDYLRMIDCRQDSDQRSPRARDVERSGDYLLCNINPCFLRYTKKVTDVSKWPADIAEAVSALIAVKIAGLSTERMELVPQLLQFYNLQLSLAQAADARELRQSVPDQSQFVTAREMASGNR